MNYEAGHYAVNINLSMCLAVEFIADACRILL
jgi:hypothetical protein